MTMPGANRPNFPELYESELVEPLFRPWAEALLDLAGLEGRRSLLDLACGTGIVARLAQDRLADGARLVGVDVSPQMLAVARRIAPDIEWREGDAVSLPVGEDERFDAVVCQQGLQFFTDRSAAAREMRRVLAPAGRLVVATWRPIEEVPVFLDLQRVAERHVGPVVDRRHGFGDAGPLARLLTDAGFEDVRVETRTRTTRVPNGAAFVRLNAMAVVGMSERGRALGDDDRARAAAAIADESAGVLRRYADGEAIVFEIGTNVATARR